MTFQFQVSKVDFRHRFGSFLSFMNFSSPIFIQFFKCTEKYLLKCKLFLTMFIVLHKVSRIFDNKRHLVYKTEKAIKVSKTHCVKSRFYAKKTPIIECSNYYSFLPKNVDKQTAG